MLNFRATSGLVVCALILVCVECTTSPTPFQTTTETTTTSKPETDCTIFTNCTACVQHAECLWCESNAKKCGPYPVGQIIPHPDVCPLGDARWGTCKLNYKTLLICMGVAAGIIVLTITCCCVYCCCCRNRKKAQQKLDRDESRYDREREERHIKHEERKAERRSKYDEIRRKYGIPTRGQQPEEGNCLIKDDSPYQKFENEA